MADSLDFLWADEGTSQAPVKLRCPNCGNLGEKSPICFARPGNSPAWSLLLCPDCTAGFYENQTVSDYADEGMSAESTTYFLQQGAAVSIFADILAHIQKPPGAVYVEIGCGFGFGLDVAQHAMGWQARGMDPAELSAIGRHLLGVDITPAYFDPTTVPSGSCDVVMATEVLEHLPDPAGFLREIRRGLKPDGIAVLTTPDIAAVRPAIAKPVLSATLTVGLHLILQSAASLEFLLRQAGFTDVRVESDGWKLTAFAATVPLALRDDRRARQAIAIRYLIERSESRAQADDLYFGFAGRAFFEAVSAQDQASAARIWNNLGPRLHNRYNIDLDTITAKIEGKQAADHGDISALMPLNLAAIMLARAYQRLQSGEARAGLLPRFAAINAVCAPLWAWLSQLRIGDMQTRQILWVAQAEVVLCIAAQGRGAVLTMIGRLPESPTGAGRDAIVRRAVEFLIHGERPNLATRLARQESLPHMRQTGDISTSALAKSFAREMFYRARQKLRG
ncbi:class I SAM-dependent methyltransferase [Acidisoma cellulosilytica]|uniref:Class I SAM-dependent methyltransferase n=1 Tax=Acidisoma cellulosilyticum TaxID=2802395 RepID=A0A964E2C5_9PROT|nr:class I SAM-dependent methyltransferase [Acidisoma cellulosilyticum]MCB8879149.1 class I SAM-dependent methyltransferase [Acidisoma cellulosilyticum]